MRFLYVAHLAYIGLFQKHIFELMNFSRNP